MSERISPYALLKKSKPKIPETQPEPYDLYSQYVQDNPYPSSATSYDHMPLSPSSLSAEQSSNVQTKDSAPERKTHYVSDIHTRHSKAFMRTSQSTRPLS